MNMYVMRCMCSIKVPTRYIVTGLHRRKVEWLFFMQLLLGSILQLTIFCSTVPGFKALSAQILSGHSCRLNPCQNPGESDNIDGKALMNTLATPGAGLFPQGLRNAHTKKFATSRDLDNVLHAV